MDNYVIDLHKGQISHANSLVLNEVNFQVGPGEFVYLIGKTGSGKTTLLRTLYGDMHLNEGEGRVAGFDLTKLKTGRIPYLRRKLGIIFQDFQLLTDRNIRENLLFVMKATGWKNPVLMKKRVLEVLRLVQLDAKDFKMPHELSGGEQQKVVIARALINDPHIILADEPTGNLDPQFSDEILKLLHHISSNGTAVLMATHNYSLIDKFPARVVKVENNRLYEIGTTHQSA
ncbi:MAG: ATP-binding cassette domain-containing protein [Bacteroidota bacterium]|nr:ATP-binding cassette domain-containing protein [Bacteroidota bacterium]